MQGGNNVQKAFDKIFGAIIIDLSKNIDDFNNCQLGEAPAELRSKNSGSEKVKFHVDENGQYIDKYVKYGAGVTVRFKFTILNPKANYTVSIKSSDGGGGSYKNVRINQTKSGTIKTSFWHSTSIFIDIYSDIKDVDVTALLEYSY